MIIRPHAGYERILNKDISVGINLYYYYNNVGHPDYKGELFTNFHIPQSSRKYIQLKFLMGYHTMLAIEGIGQQEKFVFGVGFYFGNKFLITKRKLYLEYNLGVKYYPYPFHYDYGGDPFNDTTDSRRAYRIEKFEWYTFYPGSFFETNFILGYSF
jgi:hypothetical protein